MKYTRLLLFLLLPVFGYTQDMTEKQLRRMAKEATEPELIIESSRLIQEGRFYFAEIVVDRLMEMQPNSANYHYRKGFLLLSSHADHLNAIPHFLKALPTANNDYDIYSITDTTCPTDVYYYLGKSYHLAEEIETARTYYTNFLNFAAPKSDLLPLAHVALLQCDVADHLIANPKKVRVDNISSPINTKYPEYSPVISLDGQALYFTSRRPWPDGSTDQFRDAVLNDFPEDIYVSYKGKTKDIAWTEPEKLEFCEGQRNEATIAVSPDERRVYVYQDNTGGGDIFFSDFQNSTFQQVQPFMIKDVNTKSWETHITTTTDGQNMYFVSDRPGGFGGRDIYRIVKLPDGSWSAPKNLGANINTAYDEDAPFIGADNKTLFFSSNGHLSMGGFDIFSAIRDDNNEWSNPINMGYPINRTGDDVFYTTTIDGRKGYFSSFRKEGYGEKDIYEIHNDELGIKNIAALRGIIKTAYNKPFPVDMTLSVKCTSCDINEPKVVYPRLRDGTFFTSLEPCKEYVISYLRDNGKNEFFSETISTSCVVEYDEIYRDLLLDVDQMKFISPDDTIGRTYEVFSMEFHKHDMIVGKDTMQVNIGNDLSKLININPIYFDLDKSNIRKDAAIELDKIVKVMNENPSMVIELGSHTDCRASIAYNNDLSARRAKSSAAYIKKRITDPKRIYGKGYGESKLVNDCGCEGTVVSDCTEEQHQMNRRTEFIIIKMK